MSKEAKASITFSLIGAIGFGLWLWSIGAAMFMFAVLVPIYDFVQQENRT